MKTIWDREPWCTRAFDFVVVFLLGAIYVAVMALIIWAALHHPQVFCK